MFARRARSTLNSAPLADIGLLNIDKNGSCSFQHSGRLGARGAPARTVTVQTVVSKLAGVDSWAVHCL